MNTKHIILMACAALLGATQANAQRQDLLILTANTDARAAAMGNASAAVEGTYLYNNLTAIFTTDKKFTADASAALFEKTEGAEGTFATYVLSAGYKLAKRHAVSVGFRHAGGLSLKGPDLLGNSTKDYKPYNWTPDLGYTYFLGKGFAAYVMGSLIYSHLSENVTGVASSVGGAYQNNGLTLANKLVNLALDAKVGVIGPQLDYSSKHKMTPPTYLAVDGALSVEVVEKHQVVAALSSRYSFQPLEAKLFVFGGRPEYIYNKMASVCVGYEYSDHDLNRVTVDVGFKYHGLRLNGAYNLKTADVGGSYYTIGTGYDF